MANADVARWERDPAGMNPSARLGETGLDQGR